MRDLNHIVADLLGGINGGLTADESDWLFWLFQSTKDCLLNLTYISINLLASTKYSRRDQKPKRIDAS